MTSAPPDNPSLVCGRCRQQNLPGDNFCGGCQASLRGTAPPPQPPVPEDGTTRYLCAAAQLDQVFGDRAIAEYLVERVRAVPPSPGVDAVAVLREAVAARSRRRLRDVVLLMLLVVLALVNTVVLVVWLVVALVVAGSTAATTGSARRRLATLLVTGLVLLGALFLVPRLLLGLLGFSSYAAGGSNALATTLVLLTIAGVVVADCAVVHALVHERFRRRRFQADHRRLAPGWEQTVRGLGHRSFWAELERVAAASGRSRYGDEADVIVHRGPLPFVGAGTPMPPQFVALPLDPAGDLTPHPIGVLDLHQHVAESLVALRAPSSLAPGGRLQDLDHREQVLIPADRLVADRGALPGVLDDLEQPPAQRMPLEHARYLAEHPREWARYYRSYQIESWDRDLTTSCFFYAGTDQRMLYLEWTHCVLPPIREQYRAIDHVVEFGTGPVARAAQILIRLPASVPSRLASAGRRFVPLRQRDREIVPERYGTSRSLRELAADDDVQTYFQAVDVLRYIKIIDTALVRAVGQFLEGRGYSVVEFQKVASATITHNSVAVNGGTIIGSTFGAGTVNGGGSTRTGSVRATT